MGQTITTKTTAYTVVAADRGSFIEVTGTTTITLLPVATAGDGFPLVIVNTGSAVVTVDGDSSETINGATTVVLPPGAGALINCDGSKWIGHISAEAGSFTATLTGFAANPTVTVDWIRSGSTVTLRATAATNGTSNAATMTMTGIPAAITPGSSVEGIACGMLRDNGGDSLMGDVLVSSVGVITFQLAKVSGSVIQASASNFTSSGSKGIALNWSITYGLAI